MFKVVLHGSRSLYMKGEIIILKSSWQFMRLACEREYAGLLCAQVFTRNFVQTQIFT